MEEIKVIFHIDELNKWGLLLKNVENLIRAVDDKDLNIEVLANSEAVKAYALNNELNSKIIFIKELKNRNVKFVACNNALNSFNIKKENLINFVDIVPVGVLELINKQKCGYSYIKP
ncbi:DsrE family protein [Clostridium hydrogenum]|uniref:DsrE family protein n=1 Tax=Clostridium hydrogenum TaxID=2855764 RepID=UPI001F321EE8|nr:DsrE family protein [Clostridium hydrogenum]